MLDGLPGTLCLVPFLPFDEANHLALAVAVVQDILDLMNTASDLQPDEE